MGVTNLSNLGDCDACAWLSLRPERGCGRHPDAKWCRWTELLLSSFPEVGLEKEKTTVVFCYSAMGRAMQVTSLWQGGADVRCFASTHNHPSSGQALASCGILSPKAPHLLPPPKQGMQRDRPEPGLLPSNSTEEATSAFSSPPRAQGSSSV